MKYFRTGAWITSVSAIGYLGLWICGIKATKNCDIDINSLPPNVNVADTCLATSVTWNTPGLVAYLSIFLIALIGALLLFTALLNFVIKKFHRR